MPRRRAAATRAARSTSSPRSRPSTRTAPAIAGDYPRYTAATAMLETAERLVTEERRAGAAAVPAARRRAAGARRPASTTRRWCSTPSCCARSPVAGWAPSFTRLRPLRRAGPAPGVRVAAGGAVCPRVPPAGLGRAGTRDPRAARRAAAPATGRSPTPATTADRREASGLVAAYLQWHLERQAALAAAGGAVAGVAAAPRSPCPPCVAARRAQPAARRTPSGAPPARAARRDAGAPARRDRHGRQRPLGQRARAAAHRGPRGGRGRAARRRRGRDRDRRRATSRPTPSPPRTGSARPTRCAS